MARKAVTYSLDDEIIREVERLSGEQTATTKKISVSGMAEKLLVIGIKSVRLKAKK